MPKFSARLKYGIGAVIIAFGPDDWFSSRTTCVVLLRRWLEREAWSRLKKNEYECSNQEDGKAYQLPRMW
jgi:hypothetical protein